MEFQEIVYSVAGNKSKTVYNLFETFTQSLLSEKERDLLSCLIKSYQDNEQFPSYEFLCEKYGKYERKCKNATDVSVALKDFLKLRDVERLRADITAKLASESDPSKLRQGLSDTLSQRRENIGRKLEKYTPQAENYKWEKSITSGFKSGVKELDALTGGFISGLVASVAAWTSHGKSTFWYNAAYINAKEGKKVAILALEIPKNMAYQILLCRHTFDYGKKIIPYEKVFKRELTQEQEDYLFGEVEQDFIKMKGSVIILGPEDLPFPLTKEAIFNLYKDIEEAIGGLDFVIWDHVNLFQYFDSTKKLTGDYYIKIITEVGVSYRTAEGLKVGTGLAAQVNREGWKRASKNEGKYNLLALSEFHEIERSSTYVVFLYCDSYMMQVNELKVHLVKHRIGAVMNDPLNTYIMTECAVIGESYTITASTGSSMDSVLDDFLDSGDSGFGMI